MIDPIISWIEKLDVRIFHANQEFGMIYCAIASAYTEQDAVDAISELIHAWRQYPSHRQLSEQLDAKLRKHLSCK